MRSALVTGASGVLGSRLVLGLAARGWAVRAIVKPGDPFLHRLQGSGATIQAIDLERPEAGALASAMAGVDLVYHLAAVILSPDPSAFERINRNGTAQVVAGAGEAGVKHFVYVSSASVTYPRLTPYGASKLAGEALVKGERRFRHTIVRPTLVYDRDGGQEFMLFWRYLERFPVVPFIGDGRARKRPVFAGDIVDGLLAIAGNQRALDRTYNLSGADSVTIAQLGRLMLAARGQRRPFLHLPVKLCQGLALAGGLFLDDPPLTLQGIAGFVNDADLSPEAAMTDLGYRPIGIAEGLSRYFTLPEISPGDSPPIPVPAAQPTLAPPLARASVHEELVT